MNIKFLQSSLIISLFIFASCGTSQEIQQNDTYRYNPLAEQVWPEWYDPAEQDTISIVAWNIEHFVDDYDSPYIDHEVENEPAENLPERRQELANALKELDADIVVFQEVESAQFIKAFADEYFPELGYEVVHGRESFSFYMNTIILSRIPVGNLTSYATVTTEIEGFEDDDDNWDRQSLTNNRMWTAEILVNDDYYFYLTNVHLKAGGGEHNENWRKGQIKYLRSQYERYLQMDPEARILIAGDLNFQSDADEMDLLLGQGTNTTFVDPHPDPQSIITHPADEPTRQLDHIIPNDAMYEDLVPDSVKIPELFDSETMRLISDHLPVKAKVVVK